MTRIAARLGCPRLPINRKQTQQIYAYILLKKGGITMKRKGIYSFILLLLCLACVVSSLSACGSDETDALKSSVDQLEQDTAGLNEQLHNQNQELTRKIEEVKAIADVAASTAELNAAIDRLGKVEAVANAAATSEALTATKAALETLMDTKIGAYDPASVASVKTAIEKIAALETELKGVQETTAEIKTAVDSLKTDLVAISQTVNETLQRKVTTLGDDLTALTGRVSALEEKGATKEDVSGLQGQIGDIRAAIKELQTTVKGLQDDDFATKYEEATEALSGGEYSLSSFEEKVKAVKPENFADDDYAAFLATAERLRFFLGRAISIEQIKDYFATLEKTIREMPTFRQSLERMVKSFTDGKATVTQAEDCLDKIKEIHGKVTEDIPEEVENNYQTILAAHENLLNAKSAAEDVNGAIDAIGTPIVYEKSKESVADAEALYTAFDETYFSNEKYMALYAEGIGAGTFVTGRSKLQDYRDRLTQLDEAFETKPEISQVALRFAMKKPLYSDAQPLADNMEEIENWKKDYSVEDANVAAMYGTDVDTLAKAIAYAEAMQAIYTEHKVEELVANITALNGKTPIVYTDYADAKAYQTALGALDEAIKAVENYDSDTDHNMETMVADACRKTFAEVCARMDELKDADDLVKEQMNEMKALLDNVKFGDQSKIDAWSEAIEKIRAEHAIGDKNSNDSNYDTIVKPAVEMLQTLQGQYDGATAKIADIYKTIQETLSGVNKWYLQDGQTLLGMQQYWNELMDPDTGYGVTNLDNNIQITVDGVRKNVNLAELYRGDWAKCLALYKTVAFKAQEEAQTITEAIKALSGKVFNDLKNYNEVLNAWKDFAVWANTYLGIDVNAENAADDTLKIIEAIQDIEIIGSEPVAYVFVSTKNYQALAGAHATATKTHEDAEAAWAEINAGMTSLTGSWTIHSDFANVEAAYLAYVKAYYTGEISETGLFGEVAVYNAFSEAKEEYEAKCKEAKDDAKQIKDEIAALEDPTFENAQSVIDATAAIRTMIEQYKSKYGCDLPCEKGCDVTSEEALKLAKHEAKADYTKQYADVYATLTDDEDKGILLAAWDSANSSMNTAKSVKAAQNVLSNAVAVLQSFMKEHQSSGEVTGE